MFVGASGGAKTVEIARRLNDRGLSTTHGNPFTTRSVRAILANPVYCGDVVFRSAGKTVHDHHEPLVSRELWERVNAGK